MDAIDTLKTHIYTEYIDFTDPQKYTITVESLANHINCETSGKLLGYRYLVEMNSPVWTNSICNKLGCLYQGWK